MHAPRLQLTSVTIGAPKPRELAEFYARLLGTEVTTSDPPAPGEPADAGWAQLRTTSDHGTITLNVEFERQWQTPVWPSEPGKQHITQHLDILVDDLQAATSWALACGATLADFQPQEEVRVCFDPAGHPFCLFT
jgi:catechol 2,3-dioxygenase-like lactoylglutathione lyase family enzyme